MSREPMDPIDHLVFLLSVDFTSQSCLKPSHVLTLPVDSSAMLLHHLAIDNPLTCTRVSGNSPTKSAMRKR